MNSKESSAENLLVQRYQLLEIVGTGAMGKVYRAKDTVSRQNTVAVKILAKALDDMKMIDRFQQEATISALLSEMCPNIVRVSDYGIDQNKIPFYVMELLEGENLADFIEFHEISLETFFHLTRQICFALETAHNGIIFLGKVCPVIHRDLKPTNVFVVDGDDGREKIKVLDFGIAKLSQEDSQHREEEFAGTPRYASPEQLQGNDVDNRADIYSLGIIMYEMLAKKLPWELEHNSVGEWYKAHVEIPPNDLPSALDIPRELRELVMQCLKKIPRLRPQNVGEIRQRLELIARKNFNLGNFSESNSSQTTYLFTNTNKDKKQNKDSFLLNTLWPKNKPQQKIVFPRVTKFNDEQILTLCTMLDGDDIEERMENVRYNRFIFQSYPHPMILWLSILYSPELGARWLPCYLDLKTNMGQQIADLLSDSKKYYLLFFPLNESNRCVNFLPFKIMLKQRTNIKQWVSVSKMLNIADKRQAMVSKKKLQSDLESMKGDILKELEFNRDGEINA
ncbi:serine/threonine protein kinase [Cyanobacterium stanieri LEGE 03274]|uniref:Serine/threonine protein kinase n=1 Tax=Cyanobacterium stanieri LEGE 03274 TaxID=1828756 RepID=A0ABR9V2T7_9CHRO|nr:serine/threonine-protein kinase [Cyanobacterium stanieri]MBE9222208.1 serine/threonine protein kinase [Cyanobacterium stanieri LEGE 03274]